MTWEQLSLFTDEELGISSTTSNIIGLTGYAQSGKDTVAKTLIEEYGYTRIGFADSIREFLLRVNPILHDGRRVGEWVKEYGWEITKAQTEARRLLQETGMVAREMFGENFWVAIALSNINPNDKVVVTDVRFTNEAHMIKMLGGKVWRIVRPGVGPINSHVSESDMDSYEADNVIMNDGTLENLRDQVQRLL